MTQTYLQGYSISFIPFSWKLDVWHRPHKSLWAFGPFRLGVHRGLGEWKPRQHKPGVWLKGESRSEFLTTSQGDPIPAGGALEPKKYPRTET